MTHLILYIFGIIPGTYWQNFWTGIGSGPIAWFFLPGAYWYHHLCHTQRCYRIGHPVDGVVKCRRHLQGKGSA